MGRMENIIHEIKPPLLMVLVQAIFAGINVMYKLAANDGMSLRIIIAYRFLFATICIVPLALIFERKNFGKINRTVLLLAFLCGLLGGSLGQNLYLQCLVLTSTTFATAMINLVPAVTYILSICFKMEKLAIGTVAGKLKMLGTLIGIAGAMVFTFYKGVEINPWSTNINIIHPHQQPGGGHTASGVTPHGTSKFILGAFLGILCCISVSLWLITQAKMSVQFPYLYTSTALMCIMGSIQGSIIAFCTEKDWSQWKLGWNVRLLAVAFTGIVGSALLVFLVTWGVHLKGPLYASIFNPLGLVFVAIVGSLILNEKLHLGSIIGGILIVSGIYLVLWGKAKEMKQKTQLVPTPTTEKKSDEEILEDQNENKGREDQAVLPQIAVV
ncbi:hypothetical protein PTKIN_Ptkin10aG0174900 [Pterospermum kingtungense]